MAKKEKGKGVNDFVLLKDVNEDEFMKNLQVRYEDDTIYTFIGNVVVSVNPYKQLPIYTNEVIETYRSRYIYELPPHIYAVASDAHRDMSSRKRDQCIIISGESGAGKTEASKQIMKYISVVAGQHKTDVDRVKDQLLKSNPVLEAFGNACTNRNDNSSRFGKYMDIQFDFKGDPVGGNITNYLLEKSRVVHQAKGERNFHIFYQILAGGQISGAPENFNYLNQSGTTKVKTINDADDFKTVKSALKIIGFQDKETENLLSLVAAVLYIGNIEFSKDGEGSKVSTPEPLNQAAKALGSDSKLLSSALVERTVATKMETVKSKANIEQAIYARDAFAKALYDRLFTWLVQRINKSVVHQLSKGEEVSVIGVLDIYGFEIFEANSFEQFCINYCNEKLQQLFIELTLKAEQEEYKREGIQWEDVKYFDNAVICNMIDAPNKGMVAILDEECLRPGKTSDTTFLEKLNENFKEHPHYESSETNRKDKTLDRDVFRIKHYAGDVTYKVLGFLDKNTDSLFKDLKSVAFNSSNPIAKETFPDGASINDASKRPVTAGTSFKNSLAELVNNLMSKNPHYIRCIKPNSKKTPSLFDKELCLHQVRYLGLLENVRVRRAGFAYRQTYEMWLGRYKMLAAKTWPNYKGAAKDGVQILCDQLKLGKDDYRMGKTKLFIRSPETLFKFEEEREKTFDRMATQIQKLYKGYVARKKWHRLKAAIRIQLKWRQYKSRKYHFQLYKIFKDVKTMPDYGRNVPYPTHPSVLDRFVVLLRKIHLNWRAKMMIKKLSPEEQAIMRKKIVTKDTFSGRKPWNPASKLLGDTYSKSPENGTKFKESMSRIMVKGGDKNIIFSGIVNKINRKGKGQPRGVVLTEKNVFKIDSNNFKPHKEGLSLTQLTSIHLSTKRDTMVYLEFGQAGTLLDLGWDGDRVSEFTMEVVFAANKLNGKKPQIQFHDQFDVDVGSGKKSFTFVLDAKVEDHIVIKASGSRWEAHCKNL